MAEITITPKALDGLHGEATALKTGKRRIEEPLGRDSGLLEFVELTFDQAFSAAIGVGVTSFAQVDKEEVMRVADKNEPDAVVQSLVNLYVDVCNLWPDVISFAYGGSSADFLEFRTELIPSLLDELEELARSRSETSLAREIESARSTYTEALARALKSSGADA